MIGVFLKSGFLARELLKMPFSRFRPTFLQALPECMMPLPVAFDSFTTEGLTSAISRQVDDAEINTERSLRLTWHRFRHVQRYRKIKDTIAIEQVCLSLDSIQTGRLILANQEGDKHAARKRQEGDGSQALKAHDSFVIDNRSFRSERGLNALITLVGFARLANTPDSQLRRKLVGCAQFAIHKLLQLKFVGRLFSECYGSHIAGRFVKGVHRLKQGLMLFGCGCKLQEHRLFHTPRILSLREVVNGQGGTQPKPQIRNAAFLPVARSQGHPAAVLVRNRVVDHQEG